MKKPLFLSVTLMLFLTQYSYGQKIRTLFFDDILYGHVKQVVVINYLPHTMIAELTDTTWYDEKGNTLEDHRKTMHGTLFKEKYINSQDASGKKIEIIGSQHDQKLSIKFDTKGNLAEYDAVYKDGHLNFKSLYEYDQNNNLILFNYFNSNNVVTQKRTYRYNNVDQLISLDNIGENGKLEYHTEFEYVGIDKAGNWIKRIGHTKLATGKTEDRIVIRQIIYY